MSIIDGGFPRIKHKVACDEDLRFRENRIKTNKVSAIRADTERPPAECRAQPFNHYFRKTETDAEHYRTAIGHSALNELL